MRLAPALLAIALITAPALAHDTGRKDSYVLLDGDVTYMLGEGMAAEALNKLKMCHGRIFLWSRRNGETHVFHDADFIDRARAAVRSERRMAELVDQAIHHDAYILNHSDSHVTFSSGTDIDIVASMRERYRGEFLWVRRGGESWLIRDADWLDRATVLFAPQLALGPQQAAVGREEAELDRQEERLEDARDEASRARLDAVHRRQAEVNRREEELDRREEQIEREAESKLWPLVDQAIRQGVARRVR